MSNGRSIFDNWQLETSPSEKYGIKPPEKQDQSGKMGSIFDLWKIADTPDEPLSHQVNAKAEAEVKEVIDTKFGGGLPMMEDLEAELKEKYGRDNVRAARKVNEDGSHGRISSFRVRRNPGQPFVLAMRPGDLAKAHREKAKEGTDLKSGLSSGDRAQMSIFVKPEEKYAWLEKEYGKGSTEPIYDDDGEIINFIVQHPKLGRVAADEIEGGLFGSGFTGKDFLDVGGDVAEGTTAAVGQYVVGGKTPLARVVKGAGLDALVAAGRQGLSSWMLGDDDPVSVGERGKQVGISTAAGVVGGGISEVGTKGWSKISPRQRAERELGEKVRAGKTYKELEPTIKRGEELGEEIGKELTAPQLTMTQHGLGKQAALSRGPDTADQWKEILDDQAQALETYVRKRIDSVGKGAADVGGTGQRTADSVKRLYSRMQENLSKGANKKFGKVRKLAKGEVRVVWDPYWKKVAQIKKKYGTKYGGDTSAAIAKKVDSFRTTAKEGLREAKAGRLQEVAKVDAKLKSDKAQLASLRKQATGGEGGLYPGLEKRLARAIKKNTEKKSELMRHQKGGGKYFESVTEAQQLLSEYGSILYGDGKFVQDVPWKTDKKIVRELMDGILDSFDATIKQGGESKNVVEKLIEARNYYATGKRQIEMHQSKMLERVLKMDLDGSVDNLAEKAAGKTFSNNQIKKALIIIRKADPGIEGDFKAAVMTEMFDKVSSGGELQSGRFARVYSERKNKEKLKTIIGVVKNPKTDVEKAATRDFNKLMMAVEYGERISAKGSVGPGISPTTPLAQQALDISNWSIPGLSHITKIGKKLARPLGDPKVASEILSDPKMRAELVGIYTARGPGGFSQFARHATKLLGLLGRTEYYEGSGARVLEEENE